MRHDEEFKKYANWLKNVSVSVKQTRLYSAAHPAVRESMRIAYLEFEVLFTKQEAITIGFAGDKCVLDGRVIDPRSMKAADFIKLCRKFGIESFVFSKGLTLGEFQKFLDIMSVRPKEVEDKGGFKKIFETIDFEHIKTVSARFEMVQEGEKVAKETEIGGGSSGDGEGSGDLVLDSDEPGAVRNDEISVPQSVTELVDAFRTFSLNNVVCDYGSLHSELSNEPQFAAKLIIRSAQDPEEFKRVLEGMAAFFEGQLTPRYIEDKKDLSKLTTKMAAEIKKHIASPAVSEEFRLVGEQFVAILERCEDEVRIGILEKIYQESNGNLKTLESWSKKLLKKADIQSRVKNLLKDKLVQAGITDEAFEEVYATVSSKNVAKKKTKTSKEAPTLAEGEVAVSSKDLTEMEQKAKELDAIKEQYRLVSKEKKRLQDEQRRLDGVIRRLAAGQIVVDEQANVVMLNQAAERLLGKTNAEAQGKKLRDQLQEEHALAIVHGDLLDTDDVGQDIETSAVSQDVQETIRASTAVVENINGRTVGMLSALSDLIKQKEINEMKSRFVSHVTHELRGPLVAIQKSLGMVIEEEMGELEAKQKVLLEMAHRNMQRLERLVNDVLDMSKAESGALNFKTVSLAALVEQVQNTFAIWAADKKISIKINVSSNNPEAEADQDRIIQVITNLMGNALKFTPEGGTITLEVREAKALEGGLEVGVRDTGVGIAKEDCRRIFERFEQVSGNQPQEVSSTGLGLAIAREIVLKHGGTIWVESVVGQGSCFAFTLPRMQH